VRAEYIHKIKDNFKKKKCMLHLHLLSVKNYLYKKKKSNGVCLQMDHPDLMAGTPQPG